MKKSIILISSGLLLSVAGAALAVWVPLGEGETVDGVRWYHNDEEQAFPELLAVAGDPGRPELIPQAVVMASDVSGASSAWNELWFDQALASVTDGLYLVFRLPEEGELTATGRGGGAGLGYVAGGAESRCWITFDGERWHPLAADYQMAVAAIMGQDKRGSVLVLQRPGSDPREDTAEPTPVPLVAGLLAAPNPFNPHTEVRFTLPQSGRVELTVYDIRGRLIKRLHQGDLAAGEHAVTWDGRDQRGRAQPSGVYVARLSAGQVRLVSRLTLIQ